MNCIFCKIISGDIPAKIVQREGGVLAIWDVNPQAPVHILVMPERHVADIAELCAADRVAELVQLLRTAAAIGRKHGGAGFRLVLNTGREGGQTVDHLHVHVLAGRQMHWPPG